MAMKFKDVLPFLLAGGAWYAWQSGMFNDWTGLKPAGVEPPVGAPGPAPGPVFGPAPDPTPPTPPLQGGPPPQPPPRVPPPTPPPRVSSDAQALVEAGGPAPKNIWEWGYYVQRLGLNLPQRDPSILGDTTAAIQAVRFTAPEYVAYREGGSMAGLQGLAAFAMARATRI